MNFSLIDSLGRLPLAFVDTETTGASPDYGDRVIEIGIVRTQGCEVVAEYQQLVNPQRWISPGITALTGITSEMTEGQPTFAEQLPAMLEILRGCIVVGHNVHFDLGFLRGEFHRCRRCMEDDLGSTHVLDTLRIARRRFGRGGNSLQSLSRRLEIESIQAHRALADAHTTRLVLYHLLQPFGGWECCLCDALMHQGGPIGLIPTGARQTLLPLELQEAMESGCVVTMEYLDADGQRTKRPIRPLHIKRQRGELLLVAYCELRQAQRTFKLERIVRLETSVEI